MPPARGILLGVAFIATLGASLVELPSPEVVQPARAGAAPAAVTATAPEPEPAPAWRERFESQAADSFAPRNWQPPPAPVKVEAPKAPPLPFRYLGKLLEEGGIIVFLGQGARTHLLRKGDVLADYRVEEITPAEMSFVYLPLEEKQRLTFGSAD